MRVVLGLLTAGLLAAAISPARAQDWCGFVDKEHSQVRCGFSSLDECKQALGGKKDAYCMLDPMFAGNARGVKLAAR
jgi:hypothetical protein